MSPSAPFLDEAKSLACVHCGLCLSACPTYLETGNENHSPRGRIYLMRALQSGRLALDETTVGPIDSCLGCRACESACPSGVQYGALLESTREHIELSFRRSLFQTFLRRVAIEKIFPYPTRLKLALFPAKLMRVLRVEKILPRFARDALGLVPADAHGGKLAEIRPVSSEVPKRGRVGFVSGCVMSVMFGRANEASVRLLNLTGYDVVTPPTQSCCGALYAHTGNLDQAREFARHNVAVFERLNLDTIIINAAGCGSTLKEYGHLLHEDPVWGKRAESFSAKVRDLTEFLALAKLEFKERPLEGRVTYHDACHLAHPQRITKQPRDLVRAVARERYVELPEADICCGSAGTYNLTEPEMAERLQRRKIENILKTGASTVITTNPGCILQMRAGLEKAGAAHIRVLHIAEFLLEAREPTS